MLRTLLVVLAIPVIGFLIATWILGDLNSELTAEGLISVQEICLNKELVQEAQLGSACSEVRNIVLLQKASMYTGLFGLGIPLLFWLSSIFAGRNRKRLANIFPSLVRVSLFLISGIILVQGLILTYAAYIGESYAIERVHYMLIGAIGIGAFIACLKLIGIAFTFGKKMNSSVSGRLLPKETFPEIYQFVKELAEKLNARVPKHIVAGLDLNFFVTSADVSLLGTNTTLKGETLFLSTPLCRILSKSELAAVIGHELGHFRGDDTAYSLKFAPVYAGLASAIETTTTSEDEGSSGLAKIPALAMLSLMYSMFSENERTIGREREHAADQAGCEAATPMDLATSLIKISMYSGLWPNIRQNNIDRLSEGKITSNLASVFADQAIYDIEQQRLVEILPNILEKHISHPTDTHPSTGHRIEEIGISIEDLENVNFLVPEVTAFNLIENTRELEEELTVFEHRMMVALGQVVVPETTEEQENHLLNATYSLAAAMVGADGNIDSDEIATAEFIGKGLFPDFDPIDFRDACKRIESQSAAIEIASILKDVLEDEAKNQIVSYLRSIAEADGEVSQEEEALLGEISMRIGAGSQL